MNPALKRHSRLWWFTVIFFLAVGGPMVYHRFQRTASVNQSSRMQARRQIDALTLALELYKNRYGNYPRPLGGSSDPVIQSKMLYQALSGDGTDFIDGVPPTPSDGNPGTDGELILEAAIPSSKGSAVLHEDRYLIDPWGRPYHYVRGDENGETANTTTFDLWSEASEASNSDRASWVANWKID